MAEASSPAEAPPSFAVRHLHVRSLAVRFVAAFLAAWLVFGWIALHLPTLPDTDSYFHLAIARTYAEDGIVDQLPWLRLSLLQGIEDVGFGDKELLFHVGLIPFVAVDSFVGGDGTDGGRWALAFWNSLAAIVLAIAGRAAAGRWGLLAPCLLWLGSLDFLGRLIRLRPETPAMVLLVLAALCAGTRRHRVLGLVVLVFTLSYTAFHALLGLCLLWFLWQSWQNHRAGEGPPWQGLAYPVLGAGLGLLVHPHFPQNLMLWKVQSIDFFRFKDQLDVGTEIGAQATDVMLLENLPWLAGCAILWLAARDSTASEPRPNSHNLRGIADALTIAAACFGVLFLLMQRFSTHALPLLTLALLFRLAADGRRPGRSLPLPGGLRVPTAVAIAAVLAVGVLRSAGLVHGMASAPDREAEWQAFGGSIPDGARVAAPWGQTPQYFYWAPTANFLNALDPVFLAVPYPELYQVQRSVFDGHEPDVPMALAAGLDSDHLAISRFLVPPRLAARLTGDPRIQTVYQDWNLLFRVEAAESGTFVVDWRQVPQGHQLPVPAETDISSWPVYPLNEDPELRPLEAYVDGRRLGLPGRCLAVTTDLGPGVQALELAPSGPTTFWWQTSGGTPQRLQILDSPGAVLGRGLLFPVEGGPLLPTRVSVLSCRSEEVVGGERPQVGFFLRRIR